MASSNLTDVHHYLYGGELLEFLSFIGSLADIMTEPMLNVDF